MQRLKREVNLDCTKSREAFVLEAPLTGTLVEHAVAVRENDRKCRRV